MSVAEGGGRLGEDFLRDLAADWAQGGPVLLATVRKTKPDVYLRVVTSILPKELNLRIGDLESLSEEEIDGRVEALARSLGFGLTPGPENRTGEDAG